MSEKNYRFQFSLGLFVLIFVISLSLARSLIGNKAHKKSIYRNTGSKNNFMHPLS